VKFVQTQDPAAAAQLVTANLRLVVKIAYEYRRAYKNIMDLVQEGNIGLMQAVKRYDPYRGVKLSSYAAWWIRAYILRFILNNWRLVKLGTTQAQRKLFFNLRKKRAELVAMGIEPSDAEVAKRLNVPESDVAEMDVRLTSSEKSLDAPSGTPRGDRIAQDRHGAVAQRKGPSRSWPGASCRRCSRTSSRSFRKTLSGKDKDLAIFDERLVADEPLTLQELGDRFGISRERVRQLEQRLTASCASTCAPRSGTPPKSRDWPGHALCRRDAHREPGDITCGPSRRCARSRTSRPRTRAGRARFSSTSAFKASGFTACTRTRPRATSNG
jgi:RNA polymerase sigma-32 factor